MKKTVLNLALIGLLGLPSAIVTGQTYSVADELAFQLDSEQITLTFNETTNSMSLPLGHSRFQQIKIPQGQYQVDIRADIYKSVFAPTAYIVDAKGQILQTYSQQQQQLKPASSLSPAQLQLVFSVDSNQGADAIIVATSDAQLSQTSTIEHPARQLAKARSNQPPNIPDLLIPHTQAGDVHIRFNKLTAETVAAEPVLVTSTSAAREAVRQQQPKPGNALAPSAPMESTESVSKTMLMESENMYNQAITKAIATNQHDLALRLMLEASENGSLTARQTYLDALKNR